MKTKVFCVGFHKTGTTSLAAALETLGYRVTGPNGENDLDIASNVLPMAHDLVEKYDAFQDNPWPAIYQHLDESYPGSKFILSVRDTDSWIQSQIKHFGREETPMRKWIYGLGCPEGNEDVYIKRFEDHNADVLRHFKNRSQDLLVMDLSSGDGWEQLCSFLDKNIPAIPFPHVNKSAGRSRHGSTNLLGVSKRALRRIARRFT